MESSSNTVSPSTSSGTWLVHRIRSVGAASSRCVGEFRGGVENVLAVVEEHYRGCGLEPLQQRGLAAGDVQGGDHRVEDLVRRASRSRAWPARPHRARGFRLRHTAPDGDRDGGLADAARSDDLDQPAAREQIRDRGDLGLASDELGRERRQVPGTRVSSSARAARSPMPSAASWTRICARALEVAVRERDRARPRAERGPAGRSPARRPGGPPGTAR